LRSVLRRSRVEKYRFNKVYSIILFCECAIP
jgi:hypothetical protein